MSGSSSDSSSSRRRFLKLVSSTAGALAIGVSLPQRARGDDLPALTESDPTAAALGYKPDAASVDAAKFPQHKTGQTCLNCNFYQGTGATAPCTLFPGKTVSAKGWCSAYAAKT